MLAVPARAADPAPETVVEPVTGMVFVKVAGGCFEMGCGSFATDCRKDEKPAHEACVDDYLLARTEVTQGQWKRVMGDNPSLFTLSDAHPVERVAYTDALAFVKKLAQLSTLKTLRIPTETEWEFACRERGRTINRAGEGPVTELGWFEDNAAGSTHPVAKKQPNALGLFDLLGNVWEWTTDDFDPNGYAPAARQNPLRTGGPFKAHRGGSWFNAKSGLRCTDRGYESPDYRIALMGFRLAASVPADRR